MNKLKELFQFIRIELCIFAPFLGMTGYLLFNSQSMNIVFLILCSFFMCSGIYAFNNIADKKEDLINKGRLNYFVNNKIGIIIVIVCYLIGFFFSLLLSDISTLIYTIFITLGVVYTVFKIKRYPLIKNLYTAFALGLVFLLSISHFNIEVFLYYSLVSTFVLIGTIISDLRDYEGDKLSNIQTLPVLLGFDRTRKIIYFLLTSFFIFIFTSNLYCFFIFFPFILLMLYFTWRNNWKSAHTCVGYSFVTMFFYLVISL